MGGAGGSQIHGIGSCLGGVGSAMPPAKIDEILRLVLVPNERAIDLERWARGGPHRLALAR